MMKREERAKQFAPFDALTGLHKAMREVELRHERIEKKELSEDRAQYMSAALNKLERGMAVKITYYCGGMYVDVEGRADGVDKTYRYVTIGGGKIYFDDMYDIKFI